MNRTNLVTKFYSNQRCNDISDKRVSRVRASDFEITHVSEVKFHEKSSLVFGGAQEPDEDRGPITLVFDKYFSQRI